VGETVSWIVVVGFCCLRRLAGGYACGPSILVKRSLSFGCRRFAGGFYDSMLACCVWAGGLGWAWVFLMWFCAFPVGMDVAIVWVVVGGWLAVLCVDVLGWIEGVILVPVFGRVV